MAGDWSKRVSQGDPVRLTAQWYNNVTQAARANLSNRAMGGAPSKYTPPEGLVWVQNNSGGDRAEFDVMGIDTPPNS
ncbi:MAG TPA: hypothetical protein VGI81_19820, partial [Tepidisphaeraceae bacterium]